jgi:hypothetical protein
LAKFLLGQKLKNGNTQVENPELEETVKYSLNSKQFLKEHYNLSTNLKNFHDTMRTSLDRSLKESLLKSERKVLTENAE